LVSLGIRSNSASGQFEAESFSADFDAIEVFNGKRIDGLFSFSLPERDQFPESWTEDEIDSFIAAKQDVCQGGHIENGFGKTLLEKGGHVSYPGVVNDWMNLLNTGARPTATGNSDSHDLEEELGSPRNFVWIDRYGDNQRRDHLIGDISDLDIVEAVKSQRIIVSNGPFIDLTVNTGNADGGAPIVWRVGETVDYAGSNACRSIEVQVVLQSANWVSVEFVDLYANGERIRTLEVPSGEAPNGRAYDDYWSATISEMEYQEGGCEVSGANPGDLVPLTFAEDTWIVAMARGSQNLFPFVSASEDPPTNITSALSGVLGNAGADLSSLGGGGDGVDGPDPIQYATPFAMTNPIWLNIDGQGPFDPPLNDPGPGPTPEQDCPEEKTLQSGHFKVHELPRRGRFYERTDIRRIFDGAHSH